MKLYLKPVCPVCKIRETVSRDGIQWICIGCGSSWPVSKEVKMGLISMSRRLCIPWYRRHKWKDAPKFGDDWGGVIKAERCSRCELIKQTCHGPSYNKYYYVLG